MTSDESNRRMKYGHDVPRWWIPDFNDTHNSDSHAIDSQNQGARLSRRPADIPGEELLRIAKSQHIRQELSNQQHKWAEHNIAQITAASRAREKRSARTRSSFQRRTRQLRQERQKRLLHRDLRMVQWILTASFLVIGAVGGGIVGFVFGAAIGFVIMAFQFKI